MRAFEFVRAASPTAAVAAGSSKEANYLAGGTNLLDLMKEDVERPGQLVDINRLDLKEIRESGEEVVLGALVSNTDTANHPTVRERFPLLSQAILAGASQQIRNMATNGGNLNQRTRCPYFYDTAMPCNKRVQGSGCGALGGLNRMHAIFGWSNSCVAVHPSDMCVALAALDAKVTVLGADGSKRIIPFTNYHRLPESAPQKDNTLEPGELVTDITLPANRYSKNSYYLKVRDRASYAFALVSVAAALELDGDLIKSARVALGGVAHKPWRATQAEEFLVEKKASTENFQQAAEQAMKTARPLSENAFKVELAKRAIVRAMEQAKKGGVV